MSQESSDQCAESPPAYVVSLKLTGAAIEELRCMFFHGPTWDGDHPSKSGRDELFELKLATRLNGWSWLTADGIRLALANKLDRAKELWARDRQRRLNQLSGIEAMFATNSANGRSTSDSRPTIEGLERLLKGEPTP